jgi:ribose transport system substrate-binding protein
VREARYARKRILAITVGTLAACVFAAGCGSSGSSDSSSSGGASNQGSSGSGGTSAQVVAQAKSAVIAASRWPSKWQGPTAPTKAQKGKKIVAISCSQASACAQEVAGVVAGGKAIGWNVQVVDGKGDPNVTSSAIRNAVTSGADGIVLASVNVGIVTNALKFAKQHHVPVLNNASITPQDAGVDPSLVAGNNPDPNAQRGKVSGDWMIWSSGGNASVAMFLSPDAGLLTRDHATLAELKTCAGCKVLYQSQVGFSVTTTPEMSQRIDSLLDRFSSQLKYIRTPYSAADSFAVPALQSRGRHDVELLDDSPTPLQMKQCYEGKNIGAVYGDNLDWVGWEAVDEMNRILEHPGQTPPPENTVWIMKLSPKYKVAGANPPPGTTCPADGNFNDGNPIDYQSKYKQLWGVG